MMNDGRMLYLQEKYDEALKYLREDDPFESLLIESIRITPKDKSTNEYLRSPQLTLIELAMWRGIIVQTDQDQENYLKFLKKSSNKFVRTLVEILEKVLEFDEIDSNLLNSLNEREKAIILYYISLICCIIKANYEKAKDFVKEGIRSCEKIGEDYHKALMLWLLGWIYISTGYFDKSHKEFEKALEIFEKLSDWYMVVSTKITIAELYYRRQDAKMCLKLSKEALDICEKKKRKGIEFANAKAYVGLAYSLMRDYDMALKHLDDALQIFKKNRHLINFTLFTVHKALIYIDIGKYDEALGLLEEVEEICKTFKLKHYEEWTCIHRAKVLLEKGDVKRAKKLLLGTLELAKDFEDFEDIVKNFLYLVRATGKEEYIDEAIFYYKKWRTSLSFITAKDVLSAHDVRVLVDSLLSKGKDSEAYDMLLESKNRSAIDIFGAKVVSEDLIGAEGVEKIRKAEEIVRSAERPLGLRSISEAREIISEVIEPIVSNPSLKVEGDEEVIDFHFGERTGYFYRREFKDIEFKGLRGFVEDLLRNESVKSDFVKSALLELYGKRGIKGKRVEVKGDWVFIVYDGGRYWWANLNRRDDLLRLLSDILLACLTHSSHTVALDKDKNNKKNKDENKSKNKYEKLSKFYNQISEEILRHLGEEVFKKLFEYDEVIIAPAYPLMNFPYHLLMNGKKTLIEEVRVKYVPHSGVAKWLRDKGKEEDLRKALEKVTIVYYKDEVDPNIEKEAKEIGKLLPEANLIDATDIEKEELLSMIKEDSEVLHFACHAIAMPKAQYSYFEFPNFELYLSDLLLLKLKNLKMACLSACETGRFEEAIDTLGFPLAFFAKGAKCVLATLWRVYGESTKEFFVKFYRQILSGSDVYEAYHSALMKLKKRWGLMYFWGPFVYYGI